MKEYPGKVFLTLFFFRQTNKPLQVPINGPWFLKIPLLSRTQIGFVCATCADDHLVDIWQASLSLPVLSPFSHSFSKTGQ